jgi:hypothetical protein
MTKDSDNIEETVILLDKEGLADLMALMTEKGYQDSVQLGANFLMLGLIQMRVFGVPQEEILDTIKIQTPLADMVIEIIADSGTKNVS